MAEMFVITKKIDNILKKKNLSRYKISKILDYKESTLNRIINGKQTISDNLIEKLLPILEVTRDEFESWIIADKYSKESIQTAITELKKESDINTLVITRNMDKILSEKKLSRTQLSKLIQYDQGSVNKMIIGKIPMSDTVISRIAKTLEIPESVIRGWILADKCPLKILELSLMG